MLLLASHSMCMNVLKYSPTLLYSTPLPSTLLWSIGFFISLFTPHSNRAINHEYKKGALNNGHGNSIVNLLFCKMCKVVVCLSVSLSDPFG